MAHWSLRKKFSLIVTIVFFPLFLIFSFFNYQQDYLIRKEVELEKIRLMAQNLDQNFCKLKEKEHGAERLDFSDRQMEHYCLASARGSEMTKRMMRENPRIIMRYVSLIPRNPDNKADSFEETGILAFKHKSNLNEYVRISKIKGEKAIRYLKPVYLEDSCLRCHAGIEDKVVNSDSESMKVIGTQKKEILGALSIAVPVLSFSQDLLKRGKRLFFMNIGLFGCLISIWLIFSKLLITNRLLTLQNCMTSIIKGEGFKENFRDMYRDEIGSLYSTACLMNRTMNQRGKSLKKERDIYQTLTRSVIYGILVFDEEGRILLFNEGSEKIFGWAKEEITMQNITLLIPPQSRRKFMQFTEDFGGEYSEIDKNSFFERPIETSGLRKNGEEISLCLSISVGESLGNRIFAVIIQDITEQRRKEGEIIRENKKLTLLHQVSKELLMQRDLKKLAESTLYESIELTDSLCGLFLLQNEQGDLVPLDMLGLNKSDNETTQVFKPVGVLGDIVRQKRPCLINTSARRVNRTVLSFGHFSFHSFLGVPIISDHEVIGILCVANRLKGYTEEEQRFLMALADDVSLLIVRNAVEKETRILEEKFRTLFDQSGDMIVICTSEGKILTVNHRVIQLTGYSYQELIEYGLWKLYLPTEERRCREHLRHVWETGSCRFDSIFRQKEGGGFPVDIQANTVVFDNHKVIQVVIRDIIRFKQEKGNLKSRVDSLLKKVEDQANEIQFLRKAINNVSEYVVFTNQRGRIFFTNEAFCRRLLYTPRELIGQSFEGLFHSSVSVGIIDEIIDQANKEEWKGKVLNITKEGTLVHLELVMRAVQSPRGEGLGLLGISVEVGKSS